MNSSPSLHDDADRDRRLDDAIGQLLLGLERSQSVDLDRLIAANPDLESELREFWQNHCAMCGPPGEASQHDRSQGSDTSLAGVESKTSLFISRPDRNSGEAPSVPQTEGLTGVRKVRPDPPARIGKYELLEELGRGGMGVVFRARDERLGRQVALKLLQADGHDESAVRRFHAEAEATAALSHRGIVAVHDAGEEDGRHFYAMTLAEGRPLSTVIKRQGPLPPRDAAAVVHAAALAAHHAHRHGVIHRDIKPSNLIIDDAGAPMLVDFGLAKRDNADLGLTMTGQIIGTLAYMAPEQAAGRNAELSAAADIYGLGAVLYTALTGRPPFGGESQAELIVKVLSAEPLAPRLRGSDRDLSRICMKCLEKSPEERYASCAELAADLERYLSNKPIAATATWQHRLQSWVRQRPSLTAHLGVLLLIESLRHVKSLWSAGEENDLRITLVLAGWALLCFACQRALRRFDDAARTVWTLCDLALLTGVLTLVSHPHGPLLAAYPLLIACCALLFRVRLVVISTIGAMAGYATLVALRPTNNPPHYHVLFIIMLACFGVILGAQLRHLRLLEGCFRRQAP